MYIMTSSVRLSVCPCVIYISADNGHSLLQQTIFFFSIQKHKNSDNYFLAEKTLFVCNYHLQGK